MSRPHFGEVDTGGAGTLVGGGQGLPGPRGEARQGRLLTLNQAMLPRPEPRCSGRW